MVTALNLILLLTQIITEKYESLKEKIVMLTEDRELFIAQKIRYLKLNE